MTNKLMGAIRKGEDSEVRVTQSEYKGRSVVDIRVWYKPTKNSDYVPSRKGITVDSTKIHDLAKILEAV